MKIIVDTEKDAYVIDPMNGGQFRNAKNQISHFIPACCTM
jgi:hypothetical protein